MCFRSKRSHVERKDLKGPKELSGLSVPPYFSELSEILLKSPVRNYGELLEAEMSVSRDHTSDRFVESVVL